jgi:hypothetical protein
MGSEAAPGRALGDNAVNHPEGQKVTIVTHRPGSAELPWVQFLLGRWAGEVVDDPSHTVVLPDSLVICDRLDRLSSEYLAQARRIATVGLLHTGDMGYRAKLGAYRSFAWVWRTYHHTALTDLSLRQIPLGPAALASLPPDGGLVPAAGRPVGERGYAWSFAGELSPSASTMIGDFRSIRDGHHENVWASSSEASPNGLRPRPARAERDYSAELAVLADTVFAPCPMGLVHLESHHIYDALEVGAIPIVERRRWLDYFGALYGDHPLPVARSWTEAAGYVRRMLANETALAKLQRDVGHWWVATKRTLAATCQDEVAEVVTDKGVAPTWTDAPPLDRPAPRWRNRIETLRHRDLQTLKARVRRR